MRAHWIYLKYVLRHKWFVFLECLKLGVPLWIAIFHDWDKFMPDEWFAYVNYFHGEKIPHPTQQVLDPKTGGFVPKIVTPDDIQEAWDQALNLHYKRNRHHWQFYVFTPDKPRQQYALQSYDGGTSHIHLRMAETGRLVAVVWDCDIDWLKVDRDVENSFARALKMMPVLKDMPDVYRREMLADWRGAGRASGNPDTQAWYLANRANIFLHPETQAWIEAQLGIKESVRL